MASIAEIHSSAICSSAGVMLSPPRMVSAVSILTINAPCDFGNHRANKAWPQAQAIMRPEPSRSSLSVDVATRSLIRLTGHRPLKNKHERPLETNVTSDIGPSQTCIKTYPQHHFSALLAPNRAPVQVVRVGRAVLNQKQNRSIGKAVSAAEGATAPLMSLCPVTYPAPSWRGLQAV